MTTQSSNKLLHSKPIGWLPFEKQTVITVHSKESGARSTPVDRVMDKEMPSKMDMAKYVTPQAAFGRPYRKGGHRT